jgi:hypothetical protein
MRTLFNLKIKNIIVGQRRTTLLLAVLFLLLSARGWGQATASNNGPVCVGTSLSLTGGPNGMLSYLWSGPGGFTSILQSPVVSGSATLAMAGVYTLTVNGTSLATTTVVVNPLPGAAGTITGPSPVCQGQVSVSYSVSAISNATSYEWAYSGIGGTITGTTNSVTITFAANATSGNLTVRGVNTCGNGAFSLNYPITVDPLPGAAGTITGPSSVCQGQVSVAYSVPAISNATSYEWAYSGIGETITGTTNSVTITFANNATSGNLTVRGVNTCGNGAFSLNHPITVNPLPIAAGTITGPSSVCQGQLSVAYTVPAITNATSYAWAYSGVGATIIGTTNSVTITFANNATSGNLTVRGVNTCGNGVVSANLPITVNPFPAAAGTISGSAAVCQGQLSVAYSVPPITNATSYEWVYTGIGETITGTTNAVTITFANNATSGNLTVRGVNSCGNGVVSANFSITMNPLPAAAGTITGTPAVCQGQSGVVYSVPSIIGANGYTWILPAGASITAGSNTNSITVSYSLTASSGNIAVQGTNGCGSGTVSSNYAVIVNPIPIPTLTSSDADNVFCSGTSITFTASGGTNYNFRVAGATVQNGLSATYTTSLLTNGQIVSVVVSNATGCSAAPAQIQNIVNPLPFIIISTSPTCSVDYLTYYLAVTVAPGSLVTSTSGTVTNTGGNVWSITNITALTNVTIRVTDGGGCETTQVVTAPVCSCPVIAAPESGGDRSYCALGIIPALTATVPTTGLPKTVDWYNASSGGTELLRGSLSYTPSAPGTYFAAAREISSNCMSSIRTPIVLTMNSLPIPTLTSSDADNIICSGTSVTFTAGGGTMYNFRVGGISVQNGPLATYTTSSLTNNSNGCTAASASILNRVNAVPLPTLTSSDSDNRFCAGTSVTFTAGGGTSYNFRVGGVSVQSGVSATYITTALSDGQVVDVIVTNASGCSATSAGITNTVFSSLTATLTSSDADNIFCSGTSITFTSTGGTSYNFRVGGISVQNGASPTYTTSSLSNGQTVDVIASNSSGCAAVSALIINTVNPSPTANAGTGGDECDLNFRFSAVPGIGTGTWTLTSGPGIVSFAPDANSATATVSVSEYGTYVFSWTEISGSCSKSSTITVNFYLQPVANAGTGGNNCGLQFNLNGTLNAGTGTWSRVSGPGNVTFSPNANSATASVTVTAFGSYTFRWSVTNGTCSNSSTVSVNFIQQTGANAGSDGSECDKDFIFNAVVPTSTGTWTKVSGPGNVVFSPDNHQPNAKVTVDQFGTYRFAWTVVNITCTSSDMVDVVFHDLPIVNAGIDTEVCKGSSIQLNAQGVGTFAWSPASLVNNPAIRNPVATPITSTTLTVVLTDQFGCKNSDGILLEVREKPVANAGPDQLLEYLFETTMDAVPAHSYETGVWSTISGAARLTDKTLPKTFIDSLSVGTNEFLWTVTSRVCPSSSDTKYGWYK